MASYASTTAQNNPFGLRELRVQVGATNIALSPAQTAQVTETLITAELTGDDSIVAVHAFPIKAEGQITAGGVPLAAWALMTGRTIGSAGSTPTRVNTMPVAKGDQFPYFKLYGRSVADDGGDIWIVLYKCKLSEGMSGQFAYGEFRTSGFSFTAVPDSANSDKIFDVVQHETTVAVPTA